MDDKSFTFITTVDSSNIVDTLVTELDYEELKQFIIKLDEGAANWDFTKKVYKYFKKQMKIKKEEDAS